MVVSLLWYVLSRTRCDGKLTRRCDVSKQNFVFPNLPLPSYRRRDVAQAKMREFYIDILQRRRASTDEVRRALSSCEKAMLIQQRR